MARPVDIEKRRDLAMRAVEVLQKEGLDISNSRLADALGVKRPTLLYYFPARARLVEQALEELLTEQMVFVMERVNAHTHPIDRLYAQLCAVHEFHRECADRVVFLSQAIATSARSRMARIFDVGDRVFRAQRDAAKELVRAGIEDGTVAPCDPDALVSVIRALTDGLMVQRVMLGTELEPAHDFVWKHLLEPLKREGSER